MGHSRALRENYNRFAIERLGERRATMTLDIAAVLAARPFDLKLDSVLLISRPPLDQPDRLSLGVSHSRLSRTQIALEALYDVLRVP